MTQSAEVKLYTLREVARFCRVSIHTVRYWVATDRITSVRPARLRMVRHNDLTTFLRGRRRARTK